MKSHLKIMLCLPVLFLLAGCEADGENLQQWMANEQATTKPIVQRIDPPKEYIPQSYIAASTLDPFSKERLASVLRGSASASTVVSDALVAPERARRREQLEDFPLDTISMVGFLKKNTTDIALIKVDGLIYQVSKGMYMGQNYGKILKIADSAITLREIVQDGVGEWVEREAVLELQEAKK